MGSNGIVNEYVNPFRSSDKNRWGGGVLTLFVRGQACVLQYRAIYKNIHVRCTIVSNANTAAINCGIGKVCRHRFANLLEFMKTCCIKSNLWPLLAG